MLLDLLRIRDDADAGRLLAGVGSVERALSRLETASTPDSFGSCMAPEVLARSVASSVRLSRIEIGTDDVVSLLAGEQTVGTPTAVAASRGVADALHAVLDRPGDLPLSESQLKYLQSLLLRHDAAAAAFRRQYRREGADALSIPANLAVLISWTKEQLEEVQEPSERLPAYIVIAAFAWRLLDIRPFTVGNARLARTVVSQLLVQYGYAFQMVAPVELQLEARASHLKSALDSGDAVGWVAAFLESFAEAAAEAVDRMTVAAPAESASVAVREPEPVLLTPRQERVLTAMRERGAAKIGDLLLALGIPRATLKKDLRELVGSGRLSSTGVRKGTVYRVLPESRAAD